jgi:hypothetical protein
MAKAELVHQYATRVRTPEGERFVVQSRAQRDPDGTWIGWLMFVPESGRGPTLVTDRETTQASRLAIETWALGLESSYFEGAFVRAKILSAA